MNDWLEQYETIFQELKKELRWKVAGDTQLMYIAGTYVMKQKPFSYEELNETAEQLKEGKGMFSTLRSNSRFTLAAVLNTTFDEPKESAEHMKQVYDALVEHKLKRGEMTYVTALTLLSTADRKMPFSEQAEAVRETYKAMQSEHPFITSEQDYPLATLLSHRSESTEEIMKRVEHFYTRLAEESFMKGNDLQFLSHILSLDTDHEAEELIRRTVDARERWKNTGLKFRRLHYPAAGMLALTSMEEGTFQEVHDTAKAIQKLQGFRWHRDWNERTAAAFVTSRMLEDDSTLHAGLYAAMDTVIQAQNAAMISSMAAASAAASSNS
ncbi:DUF4003 family protein [Alkalicoccus urumqiensis]|uniref:DUF4003 domain-containing protein n=1 Tax=Alkalicoccus urumqiensis TaxID=1548213 RepID=A0A2P6MIG3_ALKUR|nr:DUF4003 family protein [Alkalicoccus urumqiensis]PRO66069.1 DUF4003 domain-containing protein [Alkalicoccus urumqiensis]